ncbi:DUF354 domain-containing protein [Coraliomargarita sp. W4R72]
MRILLEAHHPADIHFFKFAIRELQQRGHAVKMIARDRDVMAQLLQAYDWIDCEIPKRRTSRNRVPILEMLERQWTVACAIRRFKPDLVASSMGSYTQSAKLLRVPSVIFTDSEFQHFNHKIAHPFADEIHTPNCFYKELGRKQVYYRGIHEMACLSPERFTPNPAVLAECGGLTERAYVLIRLSAWNTLHDINHTGMGAEVERFIEHYKDRYQIVICAEENAMPEHLRRYAMQFAPEKFHDVIWHARFVLTEGASTASEASCLGVPTVYVNSTESRGYLDMLEKDYGLVRGFATAKPGVDAAIEWLDQLNDGELERLRDQRLELFDVHEDVTAHIVKTLERMASR